MAETRTIRTVLELNAQRYTAGAAAAATAARRLSSELASVSDATGEQRANYDRVANSLLGFGTAAATGLGLATKASMDWESAWAGVVKTVDGSPEELAALEEGLRGLTRELPATHQEIAGVAEAAGQLGVAQEDILGFTKTMVNLGETTNLTSEEAATSLAQLMNIMGTSGDDVDRLGAALVALGNDGASTEKDILAMGMRVSAVGAQMGMTEADVLALASAMSSVGIEAEAGGTAISMVMKKIDAEVRDGGEGLQAWADLAGMTASEFATAWRDDAAGALTAVTTGLGEAGAAGEDMNGILSDLGVKGIREADTMLRLAQSGDLLARSFETGNKAFKENLALTAEAEQRYKTTEAQLQLARNALVDAGIDIGASVLPVLADAAGGIADLAGWFGQLPEPVQSSVTHLGAAAAATGLLAGGLMKVVPAAIDTVQAFRDLRTTSPQVASGLSKVAGFATRAGAAFVALQAAGMIADQFRELETSSEGISAGLLNAAQHGDITKESLDHLFAATGTGNAEVRDLAHALEILDAGPAAQTLDFLASGVGVFDTQTEVASRRINELDTALASLHQSGNAQLVAEVIAQSGVSAEELIESLPTLQTELTKTATEMGLEADAATLAKIATGELIPVVDEATGKVTSYNTAQEGAESTTDGTTDAVEEQVDALAELQDLLEGTANLLLGVRGSERDLEAAIDDATASVEEHGKTLDRTTEAGRANEAALDAIASAAHGWANEADEAGASAEQLDGIMQRGRENFIRTAEAMGMSTEEATALADEMQLIPDFVETEVKVNKEQAEEDLKHLNGIMTEGVPPVEVPVTADTNPAQEEVTIWGSQVGDAGPVYVPVSADTLFAEDQVESFYQAMMGQDWTIEINGETVDAEESLGILIDEINAGEGTVVINGTPVTAESSLLQLIDIINASGGVVTIDGDAGKAWGKTDDAVEHANSSEGTIGVNADTSGANRDINNAARDRGSYIDVDHNASSANSQINSAARDRNSRIYVRYSVVGGTPQVNFGTGRIASGAAHGGWIAEGLSGGGWVPGSYPGAGTDNVLWPVMSGKADGGMLAQPLAGTEYVVNGQSAQQWGPALEAINSGITPAQLASLAGSGGGSVSVSQQISGLNAYEVARESRAEMQHVLRNAVPTLPR